MFASPGVNEHSATEGWRLHSCEPATGDLNPAIRAWIDSAEEMLARSSISPRASRQNDDPRWGAEVTAALRR